MKYLPALFSLILWVSGFYAKSQVSDDFSDGDFTSNPVWGGNTSLFEVVSGELRLNNPSPASNNDSYLSTGVSVFNNMVWEFYVKLDFNPSSTNQAFVYLFSDQSNLTGSLNGYYINIGNTADEVSLYKQTGTTKTILINGTDGILNVSSPAVRVKVTRSSLGEWKLYRDISGGTSYTLEGSVTDLTYVSGAYFGLYFDYTSSRNTAFHFDDLVIEQMKVSTITVLSATQFEVLFNQELNTTNAQSVGNYSISGLTISSTVQDATDKSKMILTLDADTPLTTGSHMLQIGTGLTENATTQKSFSYTQLEISSKVTTSAIGLRLTFNDDLKKTVAETVGNFSVDNSIGTPATAMLNSTNTKQLDLTFSNSFTDGVNYQISLSNLQNESGNSTLSTSSNFNFVLPLLLQSAEAKSVNTVLLTFNKTLNQASAETASNYSVSASIGTPSQAVMQSDQKSVLLTLNTNLTNASYSVTVSNVQDSGSNTISSSDNAANFSYLPLTISSLTQVNETSLTLTFNQSVEEASASLASNYSLTNGGSISSSAWQSGTSNQVTLIVSGMANSAYTLTVNSVKNTSGNVEGNGLTKAFDFNKKTEFKGILITEVLADFTVPTGQTATSYSGEFVELYNPGTVAIRLENFRLNNEKLPAYTLNPSSYVVVVDNSSYTTFSSTITNLIQVTNFDALSTPSDSVILRDQYRNLVDSITYQAAWFDDNVKDDGGYSLELINPNLTCSDDNNWTATLSTTGGTAGAQNSVYSNTADTSGPTLVSLTVTSSKQLKLVFSEPLDDGTVSTSSFSLSGNSIAAVSRSSYTTFTVTFANDLVSETTYSLTFSNIKDCSGNALLTVSKNFRYDVTGPKFSNLVQLSPNQVSLICHEPLNKTIAENEDNFLLDGIKPSKALLQDSAKNRVQLTFDANFVKSATYSLQAINLKDTLGNATASLSASFTYEEKADSVYMVAGNLGVVYFNEKPSPASVVVTNFLVSGSIGVPSSVWIDKDDSTKVWVSLVKNLTENTAYSLYIERLKSKTTGAALATPVRRMIYDTKAPTFVGVSVLSDTSLLLSYDESLSFQKALASSLYTLEDGAHPKRVTVSGKTITLVFQLKFAAEIPKKVTIQKGITDLFGNATSTSRTVDFTYDPLPPRILAVRYQGDGVFKIMLNERPSSLITTLTNYEASSISAASVTQAGPDSLTFKLTFSGFSESQSTSLSLKSLTDKVGNIANDTLITVNTLEARVKDLEVKNDSTLILYFNRSMGNSAGENTSYLLNKQSVKGATSIDSKTTEIKLASKLANGSAGTLSLAGILDATGASLADTAWVFQVQNFLTSSKFLNSKTLELKFSTSFASLIGGGFKLETQSPQLAQVDGADPTKIRLIFQNPVLENKEVMLLWTSLVDKYDRKIPDWRVGVIYDTKAPEVTSISSDFFSVLTLTFNESLDKSSAEAVNAYSILGIGRPLTATNAGTSVKLDFQDKLSSGTSYQLVIDAVSDASGNFLKDTIAFTYTVPKLPTRGQIIFNEIMADPTPPVGLPEVEYLELLNVSNQTINLKTLKVVDAGTKATLPDYELSVGAVVLLASTSTVGQFSVTNKVGVSGFPSLGNTKDSLVLQTIFGALIDRVVYKQSWFKDGAKKDGGYSLELINPESACPSSVNWKGSTDPSGGTPGKQNSVYSLNPDTTPPTIIKTETLSPSQILVTFNESMDSLSLINGVYTGSDLPKPTIKVEPSRESIVLTFDPAPAAGVIYSLTISGVKDCSGNAIVPAIVTFGSGRAPQFGELIITEIMADPEPVAQLPNSEYLEIYNTTNDLISLNGLKLTDATGTTSFPNQSIPAKSYALLVPSSSINVFSSYGQVISLPSWLSLNNSGELLTLKRGTALIDKVNYSTDWYRDLGKKDGGYSLELINPESACPSTVNWKGSADPSGGTPGKQNSVYSLAPDTGPPTIIKTETLSPSQIRVTFSESMDSLSLIYGSYQGDNLPKPIVEVAPSRESLLLTFDPAPASGIIYSLTISGIIDCSGNSLLPVIVTFGSGRAPRFGELIISEIMADPEPMVQLPNSEYVEIFNNSSELISLQSVRYADGSDTVALPSMSIEAGKHMILCPASAVNSFSGYGSVIGLSPWLSLTNAGERLSLFTASELIFTIQYTDNWHTIDEKKAGGYSLEMRDVTNPCGESTNWGSSMDAKGGTPSQMNSIKESIPDNFGPNLLGVFVLAANELQLTFDETLKTGSEIVLELTPVIRVQAVEFGADRKSIVAHLSEALIVNQVYTVTISGPADCNGNSIRINSRSFSRPDVAEKGNLLINELLSDPRSGGVDFVEVYNTSEKYLDLNGWKLARQVDEVLEQRSKLTTTQLVIAPHQFLVLTTNSARLIADYPKGKSENFVEMSAFPTLPNDGGNVILLDSFGTEMDRLDYFSDMHSSLLKSTDGVSLERISLTAPTNDANNWRSASSTVGYGTPGYQNSQSFDSPAVTGTLAIEPKVFIPGSSSQGMQSFTTINYEFEQSGKFATVSVFDQNGRQVATLANGASLSTSGFFQWDGTDAAGRAVRMGYYVVLFEVYDSTGKKDVMKETVVVGR